MRYAPLGTTGLSVSRVCLGCMSYGSRAWRPWVLDDAAARPFFRRAVELGINFFDTADMYSDGASEEVTGRALREFTRLDETVIATKVFNPMGDGPNMRGLARKHVVQACEASLRRLGVDTIDVYYIHRFDATVPVEETLAALDHLVHAGKVRYIGASSGYAWQMALALSASERRGWARFVAMQNHYNLIYREEEREMNPLCVDQGVGIVPWSPLARGALSRPRDRSADSVIGASTTRAGSEVYARALYDAPDDADVIDALEAVAAARESSMAEVGLAWLMGRPGVVAPIVGATKLEHLDAAARAVELSLTGEEVAALERPYRAHGVKGH
jgi:1-deoxyxylulose-5-phosphate synthase